jgi:hypothetical protein
VIATATGEAQANATAAGVVHRSSHSSTLASTASGGSGAKAAKQGAALHAPRARPQHAHAAVGQLLQQQLAPLMQQQFEIISEAPVHQRYLTVYNRHVRFSPQQDSAAPGHHVSAAAVCPSALATALWRDARVPLAAQRRSLRKHRPRTHA